MYLRLIMFLVLFIILILVSGILAQDQPAGKISGQAFGDYYYILQHSDTLKKSMNGFQFRRIYLYYDHKLSEKFVSQFLIEANDADTIPSGKRGIFIKTAYLEWKEIIPHGSVAIGLIPTPTWGWGWSERIWNYRSIEKTIVDLHKQGDATDMGLATRGTFDKEGKFGYVAMIGNGRGQKPENNKYKKLYASLYSKPVKELLIEGYADYEGGADKKTNHILKGLVAYQHQRFTMGLEVYQRRNKGAGLGSSDIVPMGISAFAWGKLSEKLNVFGRFDYYDPDIKVTDSGLKEIFFVAGLDFMPIKEVHLMPNVWVNSYSPKSSTTPKPNADIIPRITFHYVYK